ncbi:protein spinster homolog 3 isoform X5 [Callorhinus ursinus]|uniref:protein spinster homolog 3 isoform X5 n=1 Tax=Callorhinus ursinus TaxID=34884 RepID=UPI003CD031EC
MCLCPGSHPGSGAQAGEAGAMSAEGWDTGPGGHPGASGAGPCPPGTASAPWSLPHWRACLAAAVLCYINLLNYMNWFIVAGMLLDIQNFFQISDSNAGLLQTVFICSLLLSAPVFGYLGDRHGRKATLSVGILLWSGAGLSSSFISPQTHWLLCQHSWLFFLSRGVVGIGSASYSTIAPTVLGDLFVRDQRTRVLAIFYIFIPVGSGLGYVLGSAVLQLTGNWHWAFRVLPCLEAVALTLLIALVPDPPRGAAEKQEEVAVGDLRSSWCEDVRYLGRNWSFVWSTLGVTAIAFVTGALGFWAPKFLFEARVVHGLQLPCLQDLCNDQDSLIFGILTVVTGIMGVVLGAEASRRYKKVNPRAESLICACSLLIAAPCLYLALILAPVTLLASYVFLALGELLLSCNWAVVADILLLSRKPPVCLGPMRAAWSQPTHRQHQGLEQKRNSPALPVRGGAPVPGDSRGASDHGGPHPGGCQQPLPHWPYLQHPEGRAPRLLPAVLPQPSAELPVLHLRHRPGRWLLPANRAAAGEGPGPGPAAGHRDPRQQGQGEPSPALRHGCRRQGPLRPPRPSEEVPLACSTPPASPGGLSASVPVWPWLRDPGRAAPATASLPAGELAVPVAGLGIELSALSAGSGGRRGRREQLGAGRRATPHPGPLTLQGRRAQDTPLPGSPSEQEGGVR